MDIIPSRSYLPREFHSRFCKQIAGSGYSTSTRYSTALNLRTLVHTQSGTKPTIPPKCQGMYNILMICGCCTTIYIWVVWWFFFCFECTKVSKFATPWLDFLLGFWPQHKNTHQPTEPLLPYPLISFVLSLQATVALTPDLDPAAFYVQWAHMQGARHRVCASHCQYSCLGCQCITHQKIQRKRGPWS